MAHMDSRAEFCQFLIDVYQNYSSALSAQVFHLSDKKSRQINKLEHVLVGKVAQLCRNML